MLQADKAFVENNHKLAHSNARDFYRHTGACIDELLDQDFEHDKEQLLTLALLLDTVIQQTKKASQSTKFIFNSPIRSLRYDGRD